MNLFDHCMEFYYLDHIFVMEHCWEIEYHSLPPVTKKYDRRTKAKTTIAEGGFTHPGFFSFKLGTSKMWKGIPYKASILNTKRKEHWGIL